jgi:hypothetical protein
MATDSEAHALIGDSGGSIFHETDTGWKLAGIMHSVYGFDGQPDPRLVAVYGNLTAAADLSAYRTQILSAMAIPELGGFWLCGAVALVMGAARVCAGRYPRRVNPEL